MCVCIEISLLSEHLLFFLYPGCCCDLHYSFRCSYCRYRLYNNNDENNNNIDINNDYNNTNIDNENFLS